MSLGVGNASVQLYADEHSGGPGCCVLVSQGRHSGRVSRWQACNIGKSFSDNDALCSEKLPSQIAAPPRLRVTPSPDPVRAFPSFSSLGEVRLLTMKQLEIVHIAVVDNHSPGAQIFRNRPCGRRRNGSNEPRQTRRALHYQVFEPFSNITTVQTVDSGADDPSYCYSA